MLDEHRPSHFQCSVALAVDCVSILRLGSIRAAQPPRQALTRARCSWDDGGGAGSGAMPACIGAAASGLLSEREALEPERARRGAMRARTSLPAHWVARRVHW